MSTPGAASSRLSIGLFCGSSDAADPLFLSSAAAFGEATARAGVRLVYGGGGAGLMGAAARAAHAAGGEVLGVMPRFLRREELLFDAVKTVIVDDMHARKRVMFEQSDGFAVFPGGIGTLEEVVELLSWRRLGLHAKPIVFVDLKAFWTPFFDLIAHSVAERLSPPWMQDAWSVVQRSEDVIPTIRDALAQGVSNQTPTASSWM